MSTTIQLPFGASEMKRHHIFSQRSPEMIVSAPSEPLPHSWGNALWGWETSSVQVLFLPYPCKPCSPRNASSGSRTGVSTFLIHIFTRAHWIVTNDSSTMLRILNPEQNEKILTLLTQPIYFRLVHNQCCSWLLPRSPLRKGIHFPDLLHNHQLKGEASNWEMVSEGFYEVFFKAYLPPIIKQIISC